MASGFFIRTIRDGRVKLHNQWWTPKVDASELNGLKMVFNDYPPNEAGFIALWGTVEFYNVDDPDGEEGQKCWTELCKLLGTREVPRRGSGMFHGDMEAGEIVSYRSKGFETWYPIVTAP